MLQSDYDEFAKLINAVAELYGKELSEMAITLWWSNLKHYEISAVRIGLTRHMQNPDSGQFMPKPADVIRMIGGTTQDCALVAWSKVDKAVRQVGVYATVAFDDAYIHRVIFDMGGWIALGAKFENDWPFIAKDFEARYRSYAMRNEHVEYPRLLIGAAEAENNYRGHVSQLPVVIGNLDKARAVARGGQRSLSIGLVRLAESDALVLAIPEQVAA